MGRNIEAPKVSIVMKGGLVQTGELAAEQEEFSATCSRGNNSMGGARTWTSLRYKLPPFVLVFR